MKRKTILFAVIGLALLLMATACGTPPDPMPASNPSDSIESVIAAQERATRAAGELQSVARRATTIADATREAMSPGRLHSTSSCCIKPSLRC